MDFLFLLCITFGNLCFSRNLSFQCGIYLYKIGHTSPFNRITRQRVCFPGGLAVTHLLESSWWSWDGRWDPRRIPTFGWWCCHPLGWGAIGGNESVGPTGFEVCRGHPWRTICSCFHQVTPHSWPLALSYGSGTPPNCSQTRLVRARRKLPASFRVWPSAELRLWAVLASPLAWPMS